MVPIFFVCFQTIKEFCFQMKRIDRHYGTTSKLRTSTNWVIAITSGRLKDLIGVSLPLDNVIILTPFRANLQNDVIYSDIYTLMWRNDGRSLDHVVRLVDGKNNMANDSQPKSSVRALSYWPNRLFGFNDRTLVIVTKEVGYVRFLDLIEFVIVLFPPRKGTLIFFHVLNKGWFDLVV